MFFFKVNKNGMFQYWSNKIFLCNLKTNKKVSIDKLIKNKKIKSHELYRIEDIEILLQEKHHDIIQEYPTVKNVQKILDVNSLPVFKKDENSKNLLNKIVLHFGGDVIINGTNKVFELMKEGNGYDCSSNFLKTCGKALFEDMKKIRENNKGKEMIITKGYNSAYKSIIHVVEPYYNETIKLKKIYEDILLLAKKNNFKTIIFPLLGSGISLFKKHDVVICCLEGIYEFLKIKDNFNSIDKIVLCTITDSYWMLLKDSIPLYLDINIK
ncbi:Appr-1-p processing domain protein, putative [Plasmodium relictum]|uniref:Appr-1-p processing domain protein, putative n=1 Tax=Plasmodium relictum TaxID=85471 RepID=A0A1J1H9Y0_PLARL|nr:Appr-1-p processing domain protein, putative [Plasmodium relictum]CRH01438.1 Appr-1-p processing domain protein, putative [Plasmodium relictum]